MSVLRCRGAQRGLMAEPLSRAAGAARVLWSCTPTDGLPLGELRENACAGSRAGYAHITSMRLKDSQANETLER